MRRLYVPIDPVPHADVFLCSDSWVDCIPRIPECAQREGVDLDGCRLTARHYRICNYLPQVGTGRMGTHPQKDRDVEATTQNPATQVPNISSASTKVYLSKYVLVGAIQMFFVTKLSFQ